MKLLDVIIGIFRYISDVTIVFVITRSFVVRFSLLLYSDCFDACALSLVLSPVSIQYTVISFVACVNVS